MTNSVHNPIPDAADVSITGNNNIPIDRVEWSRNTILEFIEDYRGFRVLWDPNTKGYHIKQIKYEALKKLSRKYSTEVRVIRSKIKSLRSSFHREHGKVISGKRRGINYQPMWFAYEAIRFILDGERDEMGGGSSSFDGACCGAVNDGGGGGGGGGGCDGGNGGGIATTAVTTLGADSASLGIDANDEVKCQTVDPHYTTIRAEDVKTEIFEASNGETEDLKTVIHQETTGKLVKRRSKRRSSNKSFHQNGLSSHQHRTDSDSDEPRSSSSKRIRSRDLSSSDEFSVFGEYVGMTIRKLKTNKAQVVIKHLINNLLYDAELGKYDLGIATSGEPPHLYATVD